MDFVYVCKNGENEELRYSIRSIVNSFPKAKIWLVGGKPEWYSGDYIYVDQSHTKYRNVLQSLQAIVNSEDISEKFVLMNDDFFIIKKISKIINYSGGLLMDKIVTYNEHASGSSYTKKLIDTHNYLNRLGIKNPLNYELHLPMSMEKNKLKKVLENGDKFLWRSVYGNIYKVPTKTSQDVKIYSSGQMKAMSYKFDKKSTYISTEDNSFLIVLDDLKKMFPKKTLFEKD